MGSQGLRGPERSKRSPWGSSVDKENKTLKYNGNNIAEGVHGWSRKKSSALIVPNEWNSFPEDVVRRA